MSLLLYLDFEEGGVPAEKPGTRLRSTETQLSFSNCGGRTHNHIVIDDHNVLTWHMNKRHNKIS